MLRHPVRKAKFAFLDQRPDRRCRDDLGVRKQRKKRLLIDRACGIDRRTAEATVERELAVPGYGELRSRMEAACDVGSNDLACALELCGIETEGFRAGEWNQ
jgi:hypothetical protein